MLTLTSGRYHIKWTQLADLPAPLYDAYVAVQDKKYTLLAIVVQLKMLNIKRMSMTLILTDGVSCHHQVIIKVFLTSLVEG